LSSLADIVTLAPVPDSEEILQLSESTGICADSGETSSVSAKSSILPREQPAKQRRKKKATSSAPRIREQSIEADVQVTSLSRPKRRAAEYAAARVMADLIEEELPIDKKRRDEMPEKTARKRQKRTATQDKISKSRGAADASVEVDETSAAALSACVRDVEVKDTKPQKRALKTFGEKNEGPPHVISATAASEELAPARIPLAETDINNAMLHAVLDEKSTKSPQAPTVIHKSKSQSPLKPAIREAAPKRKRGRPRLSIHHDQNNAMKSHSRQEEEVVEPSLLSDDRLQPHKFVPKRATSSAEAGENVKQEKPFKKRKAAEATAPKIVNEDLRVGEYKSESRQVRTAITADVSSEKRQYDALLETSERSPVMAQSCNKPLSIPVSNAIMPTPSVPSIQPQPTKRKRGRPKKIVASTPLPVEEIQPPPPPPTENPKHQAKVNNENPTHQSEARKETTAAHVPEMPPISRNRPRADENVDWLFASDPIRTKTSSTARPRTTTTAGQSKTRKIGTRENLPEMDLEELLSGITSLANANSSLQSHLRLAGKSRMKG
jgi:hypothetical protein